MRVEIYMFLVLHIVKRLQHACLIANAGLEGETKPFPNLMLQMSRAAFL